VDETRCPESSRPRSRRGCNKAACPYSWEVENWSECSHPCGAGIQHRRVTCHRVNAYEWIDPEPVSFGCNSTQRPDDLQECSLGNCHALYVWRASAWQPCTASKCGRQGFQKRSLACVNSRTGSRVSRSYCPQEFRPIRKRRCRASPCQFNQAQILIMIVLIYQQQMLTLQAGTCRAKTSSCVMPLARTERLRLRTARIL
jgi:Thrombospondin type 1 domain